MEHAAPSADPQGWAEIYRHVSQGLLQMHETVGVWTVMAQLELSDGRPVVVVENHDEPNGSIVYLSGDDAVLTLPKSLAPTAEPTSGLYHGHTIGEVLGERDVLRGEILAAGHEPTYDEVASLFPPIRRVHKEFGDVRSNPHTFVGTPQTVDAHPVYYGKEYGARLNPEAVSTELWPSVEGEYVEQGIVGGWLPTVRTVYPVSKGVYWDSLLFAGVHTRNIFQQPAFYRFLRLDGGRVVEARYYDTYLPWPFDSNSSAAEFYRELFDLHAFWQAELPIPMSVDAPLGWLSDFVRHAFALEAITRVGDHPRYGTVTQDYGGSEHDGFQDVFTTSVATTVEWGMFDRARRYIDNYMNEFVRDDGSIDYRGPETGQYGRMLTVLSQYCEYSGDYSVMDRYDGKVRAILAILERRLQTARELPADDPSYGLIRGRQEADSNFVTADIAVNSYDQPYWNNSAEAWRGFRDLSRVWRHLGDLRGDVDLLRDSAALAASAERLRADIDRAVERSILTDRDMPYLPVYAGATKYHIDVPYRSSPESFDDNRVWTEFMGSGAIRRSTLDTIVAYEAAHFGSTLGVIGNRKHIVVFLAHGEGYGFLQHDMVAEFLLLYFTLVAHAYTRGTWSSFECVDMNRDRGEHTPYAAQAQLVVAYLTKWMLVFEDPEDQTLWLAKATPRDWLDDGRRIAVAGAPTRYGAVGFEITSHLERHTIEARVDLPSGANAAAAVLLRLRLPEGHTITRVEVDDQPWHEFNAARETIALPAGGGVRHLVVHCDAAV